MSRTLPCGVSSQTGVTMHAKAWHGAGCGQSMGRGRTSTAHTWMMRSPARTANLTRLTRPQMQARSAKKADALIFDCDGVIIESEGIHLQAYNATFRDFGLRIEGHSEDAVQWSEPFYEMLQNKIGGGKHKMRYYFEQEGWPASTKDDFSSPPATDAGKQALIDALQDHKTEAYKDIVGNQPIDPRPGVVELFDAARKDGLKVAVCSASTKIAVQYALQNVLGEDRFFSLDAFLAGDDVAEKKPNPAIYKEAAEKLGVDPSACLVIEDSAIGLEAALRAGMRCVITYTHQTASQSFAGAEAVVEDARKLPYTDLVEGKLSGVDDRV
ncbi:hypothetical protein ACKKBG_A26055 [Auxenochlorella protothecoides x Auxenochlorella symbiontica]